MKKIFIAFLLPFALLLSGCTDADNSKKKDDNKASVYTTVYPLQFFTDRIGGEFVDTKTIYPPGADEHTFEPSQKDMMNLADADLFIFVGLGLEGFVDNAKDTLKNEDVTLVSAGENIHLDTHTEHENTTDHEDHSDDGHSHGDIDPHVWLDPLYAKQLAESIKNALSEKMPEHKDQFEQNYSQLTQELDDLHEEFERTIQNSKNKEIIVPHAAYGYWEQRYGIEQISVTGLSSSNEPSQKELENIIANAKKHDFKYVFFEQNVSSKLTEIIQKEIGAEPLTLHNLSVLTDTDIKNKQTYFSLMENNLNALEKALKD